MTVPVAGQSPDVGTATTDVADVVMVDGSRLLVELCVAKSGSG